MINKHSAFFLSFYVHLFNFEGSIHRVSLNVKNDVTTAAEFNLTNTFQLDILEDLISFHIFDSTSKFLSVADVQSKCYERVIIIHLNLVNYSFAHHSATYEWDLL